MAKKATKRAAAKPVEDDSEVNKDRTPLTDVIEESTIKRLQDHGYRLVHVNDDPALAGKPAVTEAAPRTAKKKTAKKTARRR